MPGSKPSCYFFLIAAVHLTLFYLNFFNWLQKEGPRRKRNKKKKDPNAPKRPQSAYFLWLNEHREQIKKENPGISLTDLSKRAGEMWRELTDKTVGSLLSQNNYNIIMLTKIVPQLRIIVLKD